MSTERERERERERAFFMMAYSYTVTVQASVPTHLIRTEEKNPAIVSKYKQSPLTDRTRTAREREKNNFAR